jgi:hypothetical protein
MAIKRQPVLYGFRPSVRGLSWTTAGACEKHTAMCMKPRGLKNVLQHDVRCASTECFVWAPYASKPHSARIRSADVLTNQGLTGATLNDHQLFEHPRSSAASSHSTTPLMQRVIATHAICNAPRHAQADGLTRCDHDRRRPPRRGRSRSALSRRPAGGRHSHRRASRPHPKSSPACTERLRRPAS